MPTRREVLQSCIALSSVAVAGCAESEVSTSPGSGHPKTTTQKSPEITPASWGPLETRSRTFVRSLVAGEYDRLFAETPMTEDVSAQFDADQLRAVWTDQTDSLGRFVEISSVETARIQSYRVVVFTLQFSAGRLNVRFTYDDAGRLAGLFFSRPASEDAYSPPAYVDQTAFTEHETRIIASDTCSLPATLSLPVGSDPVPGAVLVHGSGPTDKDETIGPNKPFRDIAWGLASRGIAVLRYDKRTYACPVDRATLTLDEKITDDALAALEQLGDHPRVETDRCVAVGHSIGAMVGPRIANRDDSTAGAVMLAAPARSLPTIIHEQTEYLLQLDGTMRDADKRRLAEIEREIERVRSLDIDEGEIVLGLGGRQFWRTVQAYEPVETATSLDEPLAVFQGERDYQVTMADYDRWMSALGDREAVTFETYPDLNHLFMSGTGSSTPSEYFKPDNVDRRLVEDLADRIQAMTGPPPDRDGRRQNSREAPVERLSGSVLR